MIRLVVASTLFLSLACVNAVEPRPEAGLTRLSLDGPLDCCLGSCSSEKGVAPVEIDGGLFCPADTVPVATCGRTTCERLPCGGAVAPECCVGGCVGSSTAATCVDGLWECRQAGTVPASSCEGGRCTPPACSGEKPVCCYGCDGDTGASAACVDGVWKCPEGTVSPAQCPAVVGRPFCSKPSP